MKNNYLLSVLVILFVVVGCSDNEDESVPVGRDELSEAAKEYLAMKFSNSRGGGMEDAALNATNNSFNGLLNNFGFRAGRQDSTDTVVYEDPWEWQTCAVVSKKENADGTVTEIYDYGDGCYEGYTDYQYFMKGKYTSTYRNNYARIDSVYTDDYLYKVIYEDYGGTYFGEFYEGGQSSWSLDGYSNYEGQSTYNDVTGEFIGQYTYDSETTYTWDTTSYYSKSIGSSTYDQDKFISEGIHEYESTSDDYYYKSEILEPLIYDYTCYENYYGDESLSLWWFTYVSGREAIDFRENGSSGSFIIDYGDGVCDDIITIIEDGISYEVDLSEFYGDGVVIAEGD